MAVMLYAMRRSFNKAKRYETEADRAEGAYLQALQHSPESEETEKLGEQAAAADQSASEWFDNAVAKAVLVAPYVHPKLVAQPAQAPKTGDPNQLSDEDLAQIAAAEAANAATPELGDGGDD